MEKKSVPYPANLDEAIDGYITQRESLVRIAADLNRDKTLFADAPTRIALLDLLVTGVDTLAKAASDYLTASRNSARQAADDLAREREITRRAKVWQAVAVVFGVLFAAGSCVGQIVQAYYAARPPHP